MGLFNSTVLDCAIGMVFVFLVLAVLCTTINEWISGVFAIRSRNLSKAIAQLLDQQKAATDGTAFLDAFYAHPLISGMMKPGKKPSTGHPSYLAARTFATTVMDLVTPGVHGAMSFQDLVNGIKNLPDGDVKTALLALVQNAKGDIDCAQKNIEQWFDDTMQRASGWYKRWTQIITVCVALLLTVGTNADTVRIARTLWTNGTERALLVERAKNAQASGSGASIAYLNKNDPLRPTVTVSKQDAEALKSVLGWTDSERSSWPSRVLGWILSIVAISLGAPFWFDALSKLMNVRNAGKKPEPAASEPAG